MSCRSRVWSFCVGSFIVVATTQAREWNDVSGVYSIEADLVGFDEENVVLQREDQELGMIRSEELSEKDREFLKSGDAQEIHEKNINGMQTWTA
jgi:hypothetical protein